MNGKAIIPLVVGLGIGLVAIKLVFDYVGKAKGAGSGQEIVSVVTCAQDIPLSMQISREMLTTTQLPKALAPPNLIPGEQIDQVVGRVASTTMTRGFPVMKTALAPPGTPPGLVVKIPKGYRAIAVKVAEEQQAGGWLVPGAHVDVSVVLQVTVPGTQRSRTVSKVILENVELVAVGQLLGGEAKEPGATVVKSVTLLVKAKDVPKLHYAQTKGKVTFAVRSQLDGNSAELASVYEDEILSGNEEPDDNEQVQDETADASDNPGLSSLMENLLAQATAARISSMTNTSNAGNQDLDPFTVQILNGENGRKKTYRNAWSREEYRGREDSGWKSGDSRVSEQNIFSNPQGGGPQAPSDELERGDE